MKILLTGKEGQVGWELQRTLAPLGSIVAVGRNEVDLADAAALQRCIREVKPQLIINAAAYTAVDKAETDQAAATAVNGTAPGIMAEEAKQLGAALIHYSTDYVFDGGKPDAYVEDDPTHPLGVYGQTKLAGEQAIRQAGGEHLILRTSWVYGMRGRNFLLTMLRLAQERKELRVVDDQIGAPTWSRMIAEATALIAARWYAAPAADAPSPGLSGIYHLTAGGHVSWHGFAAAIVDQARERQTPAVERIIAIPSSEYPTPAARPANSVLAGDKLQQAFGVRLPDWQDSLHSCVSS
ncbi:MAG: dTDP-4-dehydrorhamnose reductase [Methylococcaceae bacterium]|nr:MAG: dTDP-4-dehydrorhamnose reductase [Methylococcaceae bacterium]